jgi:hypothetical protein
MEATGAEIMGHIEFLNQDNEWERFPDEEQEANLRANAAALEELGYTIICQMCNTVPTRSQIQTRFLRNEWICNQCNTVNSAGKA